MKYINIEIENKTLSLGKKLNCAIISLKEKINNRNKWRDKNNYIKIIEWW